MRALLLLLLVPAAAAQATVDTATELRILADVLTLGPDGRAVTAVEVVHHYSAGATTTPTRILLRVDDAAGFAASFEPSEVLVDVAGGSGRVPARAEAELRVADVGGGAANRTILASADAQPNGPLKGSRGTDAVGVQNPYIAREDADARRPAPAYERRSPAGAGLVALALAALLTRRL